MVCDLLRLSCGGVIVEITEVLDIGIHATPRDLRDADSAQAVLTAVPERHDDTSSDCGRKITSRVTIARVSWPKTTVCARACCSTSAGRSLTPVSHAQLRQ